MTLLQQGVARDPDVLTRSDPDAVLQSAIRKAALRFVPLLTLAYLFNYLDRTSIGFAALTMNQALGLTAAQFGFAAGIFFLGYSLFEIPSNLLLYRFGARRWLARIMITWGLVSAANALVVGPNSFYAARLLLAEKLRPFVVANHFLELSVRGFVGQLWAVHGNGRHGAGVNKFFNARTLGGLEQILRAADIRVVDFARSPGPQPVVRSNMKDAAHTRQRTLE